MEHVTGLCQKCLHPISVIDPCNCLGDYKVGEAYERRDHEYRILTKTFNMDDSGNVNGCVYLVSVRVFGYIHVSHIVVYDGYFDRSTKVSDWI